MSDGRTARGPIDPKHQERDLDEALAAVRATGVSISPEVREQLRAYGELVIDRSAMYNLIGAADRPRFFTRHVSESLLLPLVDHAARSGGLVDIGSGAGLPGIPLSLVVPQLRTLLVEPRVRKAQFLEMAVFKLGLVDRVQVFAGTAEALGRRSEASLNAGLATARAVARIEDVWTWTGSLIRPGGWLATWKRPGEPGTRTPGVGPAPARVEEYRIPWAERALVLLQRPAAT